ncbi:MAG: Phosphoribosyl-AMP cyclohydrolase [Candidatus Taylorbacteria bacterium]|nr:Phosphoribosyl-AMP cyclohydrolase [Candidatus Taylorbacteria bacterium]
MKILKPDFAKRGGVIPVIVQDVNSGIVLMLAYTNEECFLETIASGDAVYYSTSRQERWKKGETSGNTQRVRYMYIDCDNDALIYKVEQKGEGACHTGALSCFFRTIGGNKGYSGGPIMKYDESSFFQMPVVRIGWLVVDQMSV